jgi:hypothetical protein
VTQIPIFSRLMAFFPKSRLFPHPRPHAVDGARALAQSSIRLQSLAALLEQPGFSHTGRHWQSAAAPSLRAISGKSPSRACAYVIRGGRKARRQSLAALLEQPGFLHTGRHRQSTTAPSSRAISGRSHRLVACAYVVRGGRKARYRLP